MKRMKRHWRKGVIALLFVGLGLLAGMQLGSGTPPPPDPTPTATPGPQELAASAIDLGGHSCAIRSGVNDLYCWGPNDQFQLGTTTDMCWTLPCSRSPIKVPGVSSVAKVSAGHVHTCVVTTGGAALCWGDNSGGQLGNGTTTDSMTPVQPQGLGSGVKEISAGGQHTCAILTSNAVRCWGANGKGQLGDGTYTQRLTPVAVTIPDSGTNRLQIAAGSQHTCVNSNGEIWCWGDNSSGQLGAGQFCPQICDSNTPRKIRFQDVGDWVNQLVSGWNHNCTRLNDRFIVKCWGENGAGQLGVNDTLDRSVPWTVSGMSGSQGGTGVQHLATGQGHTCAVVSTSVKCWGDNFAGQLGDGTTTQRLEPTLIPGISNAVNVGAGRYHSCLRTDTESVMCWGWSLDGEVGDGTDTTGFTSPVPVAQITP